ncbi:hypothetical protein IJI76_01785 [Candidatus Saccharibacteria bacterium]|jgi:hypothetical protein|nr:hypothetical protein [Candidatus Saccharibacteria bacterium]
MADEKTSTVRWEAEEYIQHDKNAGWYIGLVMIGLVLVALSVWLRWWSFTALVVLAFISLLIYVLRPPRKIKYSLNSKGLTEGEKLYVFEDYRAFGILQDDTNFAIVLMPRKRFSPAVTIYFPKEKGEEIVDMFGARLPMEEVKLDAIDKIVRKLRI